ncbi:MAG: polysaccharide synthesis protein GtrA [Planctomycetaceae bacterium]|nr:polysaccharide synthesis protein GtrA [Planctomycetaceae bacterium]
MINKETKQRLTKFVVGGVLNNAIVYPVYLFLNCFISYQAAFTVCYCVGILWSYWFNTRYVFRTQGNWRSFAVFPSIYVFQYFVSAAALWCFVEILGGSEVVAPLIVAVAIVPITFALNKFVLVGLSNGVAAENCRDSSV